MIKKYHKKSGYTNEIKYILNNAKEHEYNLSLIYSNHAKKESMNDRYIEEIKLPSYICFDSLDIFEVVTQNDIIIKMGVRIKYDNKNDLILIINPNGLVITLWINENGDKHRTLDLNNYIKVSP